MVLEPVMMLSPRDPEAAAKLVVVADNNLSLDPRFVLMEVVG